MARDFNQTTERHRFEKQQELRQEEQKRENRGFVQVYPQGWHRIRKLTQENPQAARLYAFLAENIDGTGAVVATREALGEALNCSTKSITRYSKALEECGAVIILKIGPGANAYALNPEEVWKAWDSGKEYAVFHTRTLVRKAENRMVKRQLTHLLQGRVPQKEQKDLFSDSELDDQ